MTIRLSGLWGALAVAALLVAVRTGWLPQAPTASSGRHAASQPQSGEQAEVVRVVDGDTVKLADGRSVRYIGIDTPEMRRRDGALWRDDPEPFAREATEANRRLVEGRQVRLEFDVQPRDRYGRLLAYVYLDGEMINARLIEDGYAQPLTVPPNVRHAEEFQRLAAQAHRQGRGLWGLERSRGAADAPEHSGN